MASPIDENILEREVEEVGVGLVQVREPEVEPLLGACQNPMLIDVILSNLFGFLDFKDLGKCRRVSKQWFKLSLPAWLTKGPEIKLHLSPYIMPHRYRSVGVDATVDAFLQLVHKEFRLDGSLLISGHEYGPHEYAGLRQHKRFALTGFADEPGQHEALERFLRICGDAVAELTLTLDLHFGDLLFPMYQAVLHSTMTPNLVELRLKCRVKFPAEGLVEPGRYVIMQGLPQLKLTSLQIDDFGYPLEDWSRLPVAGWIQLLKRYPNLKTLILRKETGVKSSEAVVKMLEAIGSIRQSDKKSLQFLRRLEVSLLGVDDDELKKRPSLITLFRNASLSLETLRLSFGGHRAPVAPVQTVAELLACQAATLKEVVITSCSRIVDLKFPELPFLHSLELCGMPIASLDSLSRFPNLKSLILAYPPPPGVLDRFPKVLRGTEQDFILPSLSKLHFIYRSSRNTVLVKKELPLGPRQVLQLARFFPNLTDLQMRLHNKSLLAVVRSWPRLQQLTIIGNGVTDEGISRIEADLPGMQDLKYLTMKHFDGKFKNNVGPARITDKSLVKFLELLPNLETLQVTLDPQQLDPDSQILRTVEEGTKTFVKLTLAMKLESLGSWDTDSDEDWEFELE